MSALIARTHPHQGKTYCASWSGYWNYAVQICGSLSRAAPSPTSRLFYSHWRLLPFPFTTKVGRRKTLQIISNGSYIQTRRHANGECKTKSSLSRNFQSKLME